MVTVCVLLHLLELSVIDNVYVATIVLVVLVLVKAVMVSFGTWPGAQGKAQLYETFGLLLIPCRIVLRSLHVNVLVGITFAVN